MKIISYNVNGIRAATKKGLLDWIQSVDADVYCFQEIKSLREQILEIEEKCQELGYHCSWYSAEKKGYSGTAILSKQKPNHVEYGCGIEDYDREGRVLRADFDAFSIISLYMPSGSSGDLRQAFKMRFLHDFSPYISKLQKDFPKLIISGDYNICHKAIDIHNPIANAKTSGFLPEERAWFTAYLEEQKLVDTFRYFNQGPHHYSWWSYRAQARKKNLGWRIDYNICTNPLTPYLKSAKILTQAVHSDHCPVLLELQGVSTYKN